MRSGSPTSFEEDFSWQERFHDHFCEIARLTCEVETGSPEDDRERCTDFILKPRKKTPIRFCARARRAQYREQHGGAFSIRLGRQSGAMTEMAKLLAGYGDMIIYGFESNPGSHRLHPWLLGDLAVWRQYMLDGGHYEKWLNDDGTTAAYFYLDKMPPEFIAAQSVMEDRMILEVMTTSPEISWCIAWRAGLPVRLVEKALYRMAGMRNKYNRQPPDTQVVFHPDDEAGKPPMWSLRDCYCED